MRRRAIAALVVLTALAPPGRADPALADAIRSRAIPLRTVSAGHGFDDMEPIRGIVGNARIVALGESSHGSREIFQLKHRMVEFLASRMGFSVFAIEASMPDAARLNDYVQHGRGDPEALIEKMGFWTWSTEEVLDLVRWMRDFNRRGGRIAFAGFDMQMPESSIDVVRGYLARHDAAYLRTIAPVFDGVRKLELDELRRVQVQKVHDDIGSAITVKLAGSTSSTDSTPLQLVERCEGVVRVLERSVPPTHEGAWVVQNARLILQFALLRLHRKQRDEMMAENIRWLSNRRPGAKMILWAHNDHVSHRSAYQMGGHVRRVFQTAFVSFGVVFNHGGFRAVDVDGRLHEFTVDEMPDASVEGALGTAGLPIFALDLRNAPPGRFSQWIESRQTMRDIGARFDASSMRGVSLAEAFDALLYIEISHPSKALQRSGDAVR